MSLRTIPGIGSWHTSIITSLKFSIMLVVTYVEGIRITCLNSYQKIVEGTKKKHIEAIMLIYKVKYESILT